MKMSEGYTKTVPSIAMFVFYQEFNRAYEMIELGKIIAKEHLQEFELK